MASHFTGIDYTLSVDSISQHVFLVTMSVPALSQPVVTVSLPTWIPGSYMVRDFARNVITIEGHHLNQNLISVIPTDKQTWQVQADGKAFTLTYKVYAFDLSVRSAFINDEYAFCNGTSVFLKVEGAETLPCKVMMRAPASKPHWRIETAMEKQAEGIYLCSDYDELIDHPIFIGECTYESFVVQGVEFVLLFSGNTRYDMARMCTDLTKVCKHHLNLFGQPAPIKRYIFMTLIAEQGFGGLEHRSSTALLYPRFDLPLAGEPAQLNDSYVNFISLCSHELFHTWHVKSIQPDVLVNADLSQEVYTDQLWIYEGFTSFYDDVTLARTGVIPPQHYLKIVGQNQTRLMRNVGRFKQSIAESSFYAWTKFYKQDASAINNIVSYYNKGGLVAMGLDLLLRKRSAGQATLDKLMQALWQQFGHNRGTPADVIARLCLSEFNLDVSDYLARVAYGTEDVELAELLKDIGVSVSENAALSVDDKGGEMPTKATARYSFGATVKAADFGSTILTVQQGSAACVAGLQVNDRLIAIDGFVVNVKLLDRMLASERNGDFSLTLVRDGRLLNLTMPLLEAPKQHTALTITDKQAFAAWLGLH
ncbi:M61 family metallopeptidase [Alteromonas sp. AMM-1]|uniref:M61 family metallopeptidase n=1 Tax=Alteromonas sp. AMM-1 TaxID=3394233 RepID=UPI0039A5123F